jgi:hypothetical protein
MIGGAARAQEVLSECGSWPRAGFGPHSKKIFYQVESDPFSARPTLFNRISAD